MGGKIHRIPLCDGGCALIVQKIKINFAATETIVYSSQTPGQPESGRLTEPTDKQAFQQNHFFIPQTPEFPFA